MTKHATKCGAPCGICPDACDVIGDHDEHGHDALGPEHPKGVARFKWPVPDLELKRGGQPALCGVCHREPWWILVKVPSGGRRPTCSRCFTLHALKRDRAVA